MRGSLSGEGALPSEGDFVRLNVGGTVLLTTRTTLTSCEGSMLAAMFGACRGRGSIGA